MFTLSHNCGIRISMWNSHADWLPIGFSTNPWSNLCNLKTFCSSAFSLLELVPIGPHVFYRLALIIGPHLLIEQENHLPSVNLWRREWYWHFFPFHQNLTFFIFHTCRNVKEALRRFEMSLSLLYPFYLENLLLNYVFRFENISLFYSGFIHVFFLSHIRFDESFTFFDEVINYGFNVLFLINNVTPVLLSPSAWFISFSSNHSNPIFSNF